MKTHLFILAALMLSVGLAVPVLGEAASVAVARLPDVRLVRESQTELTQLGCQASSYQTDSSMVDVPAGKPYRVLAADQIANTVYFCDPTSAGRLTVRQPAVAGTATAQAAGVGDFAREAWDVGSKVIRGDTVGLANKLGWGISGWMGGPSSATEFLGDAALGSIAKLAEALAEVGKWLLSFATHLLVFALTNSSFLTNPLVRAAWPFVQGLANLGFMLALVFIALATTLQLEIGGGARRLLPRLFIAALLLNFSLVIAGVLIDFTRVLMAIFLNVLTPAGVSMDTLPNALLDNSGLLQAFGNIKDIAPARIDFIVAPIVKMILVWALALSVLALAVGLIVRYIMLTLLLILSPIAYLAFALPGAKDLGERWWKEFFKYLFYGPIALFFIIVALRLNELGLEAASGGRGPGIQNAINVILMVAIMIAAATASKNMGGSMSVAVLNFAQGQATRFGKKAGAAGLGAATFVPRKAGAYVGGRVGQNWKDFKGDVASNLRNSDFGKSGLGKLVMGAERDKDGKRKAGQTSIGSWAAGQVKGATPYFQAKATDQAQVTQAQQLQQQVTAAGGMQAALANPAVAAQIQTFAAGGGFRNAEAAATFGAQNLADYARHSTDGRGLTDLAQNIEKITVEADLKTGDLANISQGFATNTNYRSTKPPVVVEIYDAAGNKTGEQRTNQTAAELGKFTERVEKAIEKKTAAL